MNKKNLIDLLGWYGVIAILLAYALASFSVIEPTAVIYQLLNLTGATSLLVESWSKLDYPPAVLNMIWTLIAVIALISLFR